MIDCAFLSLLTRKIPTGNTVQILKPLKLSKFFQLFCIPSLVSLISINTYVSHFLLLLQLNWVFCNHLLFFNVPDSFEFPFFPSSFVYYSLLLLTKPLFDSRKKTEDIVQQAFSHCDIQSSTSQLPSLLLFTWPLPIFPPYFPPAGSKGRLLLSTSRTVPAAGASHTLNWCMQLSMTLPLLLSTPGPFPPLYLRELIQAKIQPSNYREFGDVFDVFNPAQKRWCASMKTRAGKV